MCKRVRHCLWRLSGVELVRMHDRKMSLRERGQAIKELGAGLAISVHVDSRPEGSPLGTFVFHWPGNIKGCLVAKHIVKAMPETLHPAAVFEANDKWPRVRNVLAEHPGSCISLLIEVADAQDADARAYILSSIGQHRIAHGIASGILYWIDQTQTGETHGMG